MVPTLEGEFAPQAADDERRCGASSLRGGMLSPRGYGPLYAFEIASHRLLRYASPLLHLLALATNIALLGAGLGLRRSRSRSGGVPPRRGARPRSCRCARLRLAYYYVLGTGVDRCSASGTGSGAARPVRLGEGGGHAVSRRLVTATVGQLIAARRACCSPRRCCSLRLSRSGSRARGAGCLSPAAGRPATGGVRALQAADDGRRAPIRWARTAVSEDDPRVTRVGALLRRCRSTSCRTWSTCCAARWRSSGPRPTIQAQVERYTPRQRRRLEVKPGITGWAQVNGRAALPWDERIELDVWYVENRSRGSTCGSSRARCGC